MKEPNIEIVNIGDILIYYGSFGNRSEYEVMSKNLKTKSVTVREVGKQSLTPITNISIFSDIKQTNWRKRIEK